MFRSLKLVSGCIEPVWRRQSSRVVEESAQGGIMQTSRHRMQQRVERGRVRDALHRERPDVARGEKAELHAINGRGSRLMSIHGGGGLSAAPSVSSKARAKAFRCSLKQQRRDAGGEEKVEPGFSRHARQAAWEGCVDFASPPHAHLHHQRRLEAPPSVDIHRLHTT
jgi:hypothetical protein